jgi:hypothetical protein
MTITNLTLKRAVARLCCTKVVSRLYVFLVLGMVLSIASCKKESSRQLLQLLEQEDYASLLLTPSDMATKRGNQDGEAWTIPGNFNSGAFVVSPVLSQLGTGSARALVSLRIPDNSTLVEKVATIRVIDNESGKLLSAKELYKNDFSHNNTFQDFELYFEATDNSAIELRVISHGGTELSFKSALLKVFRHKPGMPELINQSGESDAVAKQLAQRALDGLGFGSNTPDGPSKKDIVFVGKYYVAWIDQTGFYGKMNGLWLLNGLSGDNLDFLHTEGGRPINYLGVAEKGDGRWMDNYVGAEHYEIPHLLHDKDKSPLLYIGREYTDWFSVNEADVIRGNHLPWWKSAMVYRMGFSVLNQPIERRAVGNQLYINYEAPMTKESDGDLLPDGDRAHAHMLFADLVRYPFFVRTGYTLYGDQPYLERHYQYRNEENNPTFTAQEVGNWHLIGGLVMTDYRSPYSFKTGLNKYVRLNEFGLSGIPVDTWTEVTPPRNAPPDALWHYQQSYTMSNNATFEAGHSIHVSATSTGSRVVDMGGCTCFVHGGLEIGGGVMGSGALPLAPGQLSKIDTRHFYFPQNSGERVKEFVNKP